MSDMAKRMMDYVRGKIKEDDAELPSLHRRAVNLGLHPQPWWNADFYRWSIERAILEPGNELES